MSMKILVYTKQRLVTVWVSNTTIFLTNAIPEQNYKSIAVLQESS